MNNNPKHAEFRAAKNRLKTLWSAYFLHKHDMNTQARIRVLIDDEYKSIRELHKTK